jgi:phytoene dehydrogenase-like protein
VVATTASVAGCYLARTGRRVLVLDASDKLGGGSRTDETIPGCRCNTHSAAHNSINWPAPSGPRR